MMELPILVHSYNGEWRIEDINHRILYAELGIEREL
jgi:hypothetical protein